MTAPAMMHKGKTIAPTFARAADGTKAMTSNNNAHRAISTNEKILINAFPKLFMLPPLDDKDAGYESSGGDVFLCKEFSNMSGYCHIGRGWLYCSKKRAVRCCNSD